ncbi:hypothetical protein PFICI_14068 [Pestalotiopsis fici W106-1]|uniref:Methyltransferase type 11 domain-containing protein n=1 Tax=Pestalotiopsis fici (strain W106-1 / CGMCC3.15140) TaxID=1229662 RepID=W3WM08_PESFW|nr:uncharacterized protein PFICI_14068 [Pestalotiopsis fici W106-1]ETS74202.1 hypothetical protein PFICI_14068 [Pestalotiopsis fici W106-1]
MREETFRSYTQAQGESYATGRPGYSPKLFQTIIDHHVATGGELGLVVDVGCGTGQATQSLAPFFAQSIGLDQSEGMINSARASIKSPTTSLRFEVSAAELLGADLESPIAENSVDLLTAATAAHWFDMGGFWRRAARVLKPGGTVALWARTRASVNPVLTPNGAAIQTEMDKFIREEIGPYAVVGNSLTRNLYIDLPLPWALGPPATEFDNETFYRKEWNKELDGLGSDDMGTSMTLSTKEFEMATATSSSVTRWREAHPEEAGTEEDVVRRMTRRIEGLLHEAGVKPGEEFIHGEVAIILLMVKKRS